MQCLKVTRRVRFFIAGTTVLYPRDIQWKLRLTRIQKRRFIDGNPNVQSPGTSHSGERHQGQRLAGVELLRRSRFDVGFDAVIRRDTRSSHQKTKLSYISSLTNTLVRSGRCQVRSA
jgi:hypothetical protein